MGTPNLGRSKERTVLWAIAIAAVRPPAKFIELVTPKAVGLTECVIELEGPRGKMRIQWKGATAPDLAGLSRALWESA